MLKVLYEDQELLVAVKPAGMESQAARRFEPDMVSAIRNHLVMNKSCTPGQAPYVGVIHRLDKPVGGIMVYAQGYGFMQLYNGPQMMGFHSVAAVLIGGATPKRARIPHVLLGTFLFQGLLMFTPPVSNKLLAGTDISDTMRQIIQNGVILYALTKAKGGSSNEE